MTTFSVMFRVCFSVMFRVCYQLYPKIGMDRSLGLHASALPVRQSLEKSRLFEIRMSFCRPWCDRTFLKTLPTDERRDDSILFAAAEEGELPRKDDIQSQRRDFCHCMLICHVVPFTSEFS